MTTLEEFFAGEETSQTIYWNLIPAIDVLGPVEITVTKSQIAFRHRKAFAWAWIPGKYLRGRTAPLVLSVVLNRRDPSPRWKQIVELRKGSFMHHLELYSGDEIDDEVREWLEESWEVMG